MRREAWGVRRGVCFTRRSVAKVRGVGREVWGVRPERKTKGQGDEKTKRP